MTASTNDIPITCNLGAITNRPRYDILRNQLHAAITNKISLLDGFAFVLAAERIGLAELGEWIGLERQCCPFLSFELSVSGAQPSWSLKLTGPNGAKSLIDREFPF